jgi:acetyl-CoA carboxylase carboxyltransferase component
MVCLVMGASAGHGALTAPLSDFVVMTEAAAMFVAGPPIVKAAIGESVSKEELGGPRVHVDVSGVAHNLVPDDARAIALARRYLGYFPPNAWQAPPASRDKGGGGDTLPRRLDAILDLIDPDPASRSISARYWRCWSTDSLLEVQPSYGGSLVPRLPGWAGAASPSSPAIPRSAPARSIRRRHKSAHFMDVADAFHLPVVFLADNPGVLPGRASKSRRAASCCAHVRGAAPPARAQAPRHLLRKAFGFGSSIMAMNRSMGKRSIWHFSHQPARCQLRARGRRGRRRHAAAGHGRTGEWRLAARRPDGL